MPIEKAVPTTLQRVGETYAVIPSSTIKRIRTPEALAILAYLLDKPGDWTPRKDDIMQRFGLGRPRYTKAMRELRDLCLVWDTYTHNDAGQVVGRTFNAQATIPGHIPAEQPPYLQDSAVTAEKPNDGKPALINMTELTTTNGSAPKKDTPRRLSPDWRPTPELLERCVQQGIQLRDPEFTIREFVDYWTEGLGNGKRRTQRGWNQAFMNRMKQQYQHEQMQGASHGRRTSTDLFAEDLEQALKGQGSARV